MKKDTRLRRILKNKENWVSLFTLGFALVSAIVGFVANFFEAGDKFFGAAISASLALLTVEFFLILTVHLESILDAVKSIGSGAPKGAQLVKRDPNLTNQVIAETETELFFCGNGLARLGDKKEEL